MSAAMSKTCTVGVRQGENGRRLVVGWWAGGAGENVGSSRLLPLALKIAVVKGDALAQLLLRCERSRGLFLAPHQLLLERSNSQRRALEEVLCAELTRCIGLVCSTHVPSIVRPGGRDGSELTCLLVLLRFAFLLWCHAPPVSVGSHGPAAAQARNNARSN